MSKWMGVLLAAGGLMVAAGCGHTNDEANSHYTTYHAPATDVPQSNVPQSNRGPDQSMGGSSTAPQSNMPGSGGSNYDQSGAMEATPQSAPPPAPSAPTPAP